MGSALRKIQFGRESTAGSKVAATAKIMGALTMEEKLTLHRPDEERGSLADVHRTLITGEDVDLSFEGDMTFEQVMYFLNMGMLQKLEGDTSTPSEAKEDNNSVFTDLTNAIDDSTSTYVTIVGFVAAEDKILVGSASKFRAIKIDMGSVVNAETSTVTVKCSDGASGWLACTLVQDTTLSGGASLAQDGTIEFTPNASWATDTIDSDDEYWVSLEFSANLTSNIRITELYTISETVVWTFEPSWTSANTPQSFTIEYGDDVQEHETEYCVARSIEISGAMDDVIKLKAEMFGRNFAADTYTSLSDPSSITPAAANKTTLAIDAIGGTIGNTPKSSTLVDFSWKFESGFIPSKHGGANSYFDLVAEKKKKLVVSATIVFNSGTEAQRLIWEAKTRQLFRIETTGASPNKLTLDFAGVYTSWSSLEERDGEDVVKVTIEGEYDTTDTLYTTVVVTNEVASLI